MPYKDVNKQRAYDRNYRALANAAKPSGVVQPASSFSIKSAEDLREVLEWIINAVASSETDTISKAKVLSQLLTIGQKILESHELELRLEAVEEMAVRA